LEVALDFAHRALCMARDEYATDPAALRYLIRNLKSEANILEGLGRLDEAMAHDRELEAINPDKIRFPEAWVRLALHDIAMGNDAQAEHLLRRLLRQHPVQSDELFTRKAIEAAHRPRVILAELLERRGSEEALAEARTLRDGVAQQLADYEARMAAEFEEMRGAAAEAVRQWREERIKAREKKKGGKGKGKKGGKKKGKRGKAKAQGPLPAATIEGKSPRVPAEAEAEAEAAAAAEAERPAQGGEAEPREEEEEKAEEAREECAICLQDLELEDDEDPWGVVLRCGLASTRSVGTCGAPSVRTRAGV
jgi:tetratricopeptide (TPR) repeat protein